MATRLNQISPCVGCVWSTLVRGVVVVMPGAAGAYVHHAKQQETLTTTLVCRFALIFVAIIFSEVHLLEVRCETAKSGVIAESSSCWIGGLFRW